MYTNIRRCVVPCCTDISTSSIGSSFFLSLFLLSFSFSLFLFSFSLSSLFSLLSLFLLSSFLSLLSCKEINIHMEITLTPKHNVVLLFGGGGGGVGVCVGVTVLGDKFAYLVFSIIMLRTHM